jgi:hypothetical protein
VLLTSEEFSGPLHSLAYLTSFKTDLVVTTILYTHTWKPPEYTSVTKLELEVRKPA